MPEIKPTTRLQQLIHRTDRVLAVLHAPTAAHARLEVAGVDWVQFESPHSIEEIQQARTDVPGPFSFMRGKLPRYLSLEEHQALGVYIAWYPAFTHEVMYAALWDFMQDFQVRGLAAWEAFQASRQGRPYPHSLRQESGETVAKQRELEERYYTPDMLEKYQRSSGRQARP
jgi:2-methylisocitrate lyase-like PEP mutase family enzyme